MPVHARSEKRGLKSGSRVSIGLLLVAIVGGLLGLAAPARAETPPDPQLTKVTELEALIVQHQKEKANQALLVDAKSAVALHKEFAAREDLRKRCMLCLDTILKTVKEDSEKKSVLESVGATGAPEGAKLVRPYLKQPDREKSDPVLLTAIKVAGMLPVSESVEPLLSLMEDSKEMGVATAALQSLGAFGSIKSKRVKILVTCVKEVERVQPGGIARPKQGQSGPNDDPGYTSGQGGAGARWGALAPVLPATLNRLTGQNVASAPQWFQLVKDTRDLNTLFAK